MRFARRTLLLLLLTVVLAGIVWGPSYARGLSLVVRAAHIEGWLGHVAGMQVHVWHANAAEQLPTRHGPIASRLYVPEGKVRRATVLTPGIHAMGIDEPRLKGLAGDLAASGVAVLTIALPDLIRYRFSLDAVDEIEDAGLWLSRQPTLAPDGKAGLMGISFAGGLSVVAAGRPALRDHVAYVFSFGGHGDMQRVLRYLCSGLEPRRPGEPAAAPRHFRAPHDYGVAVILLSLADRMVPAEQVDGLRNGIETYLTASQLTLVDMTRAKSVYEDSKRIGASLPEPSHTLQPYYRETSHFREFVGVALVRRMLGLSYALPFSADDFGVTLTTANVDAELGNIARRRAQWLAQSGDASALAALIEDWRVRDTDKLATTEKYSLTEDDLAEFRSP